MINEDYESKKVELQFDLPEYYYSKPTNKRDFQLIFNESTDSQTQSANSLSHHPNTYSW